jgi:hypothetical protein|eukprot:COSAG01_NODE_2189_length_8193_cov_47.570917_10_plen_101_part_00
MGAGAPQGVTTYLRVSGGGGGGGDAASLLEWEVYQLHKRPTRLAEATFFSFVPALPVSAASSSCARSVWTDVCLCHACSCHSMSTSKWLRHNLNIWKRLP